MIEIVQLLKELGSTALDLIWLPVASWTAFALIAAAAFKLFSNLSAIYQYHLRAAILAALPAGILAAPVIQTIVQSSENVAAPVLFVIQNPIPVAVTAVEQSGFNWLDPAFWIGLATALAAITAFAALVKLLFNYFHLKIFMRNLKRSSHEASTIDDDIQVIFSDELEIPCTFGWFERIIVMPQRLKNDSEKYKMALRHELMHIQNHDFLVNNALQGIKALFYFHPLVHYFTKQADEFREIYCDASVLTDNEISQKNYANLLYELASKPLLNNRAAVNMAVNPSTLKKRIQMMKKQTNLNPSIKQSIIVTLLVGLTLTGFMACSDITDNGLTVDEVQKAQMDAYIRISSDQAPLYVINGDILKGEERDVVGRLNPKYIKSITVLKGEKAVQAYGEAGKNGVIEIKVMPLEKAMNNLLPPPPSPNPNAPVIKNEVQHAGSPPPPPAPSRGAVYIQTENMPDLTNRKEVYQNINYPISCKKAGVEGTVYIQFVVTKTGELTDFEVLKGIAHGCDEAALQAIKQYAQFKPGTTEDGEPVNVRMTMPIEFRMN